MKKQKKAIQGHPTRGKEVIQLLESFGGKNKWNLNGTDNQCAFYIDNTTEDIYWFPINTYTGDREIYTLECFEKIFPFKIGDEISDGFEKCLIIDMDLSAYELNYKVRTSLGTVFWVRTCDLIAHNYKQIKEMKKERNITLTLEKAKEWYKKGGELKEVALQAYSEEELNSLPRSWEEFCKRYSKTEKEAYISVMSDIRLHSGKCDRDSDSDKNICPSQKSAEAHLTMIQLEQLRNCWWNGWEPEWNNSEKHVIKWEGDGLIVFTAKRVHAFLVFPTREMAVEFLKCFRDLIEKAGDLI